jgi:hypothetical protein
VLRVLQGSLHGRESPRGHREPFPRTGLRAQRPMAEGLRSYIIWNLSSSVPGPVLSAYHWASSGLQSLFCCVVSSAFLLWESISRSGARRAGQDNTTNDNISGAERGGAGPPYHYSGEETSLLPTRIPAPRYQIAGVVKQRVASSTSSISKRAAKEV